jgi:hypothetical protein
MAEAPVSALTDIFANIELRWLHQNRGGHQKSVTGAAVKLKIG